MTKKLPLLTLAALAFAASAHASITLAGSWALGEAGSVSGSGNQTPLVDSIGGHNITGSQIAGGTSVSLVTTGLSAPDSTAALRIVQSAASGLAQQRRRLRVDE